VSEISSAPRKSKHFDSIAILTVENFRTVHSSYQMIIENLCYTHIVSYAPAKPFSYSLPVRQLKRIGPKDHLVLNSPVLQGACQDENLLFGAITDNE